MKLPCCAITIYLLFKAIVKKSMPCRPTVFHTAVSATCTVLLLGSINKLRSYNFLPFKPIRTAFKKIIIVIHEGGFFVPPYPAAGKKSHETRLQPYRIEKLRNPADPIEMLTVDTKRDVRCKPEI
ncbi:MAG: hypothetical protein WCE98_05030, partial [Chlorobium sp.]